MAQRTVVRHEVGCLSGALPIRCPIASYSSGAGCATSAYAHAKLVSPCGVNSPSRGTAAAAIASKSAGAVETALVGAIANDQARLERCCSRKLDSRAGASRAIASKTVGLDRLRRSTGCSASAAAGKDSHAAVKQKDAEMARMKQAFGIGGDFVEGASFDRALQEQRRQERISAREEKERQLELDARRREKEGCDEL